MRKPLVAGNWKMNNGPGDARELATALSSAIGEIESVDRVICPPLLSIPAVVDALDGTSIVVGAQNGYPRASGAFTGELSMALLAEVVGYVIVGHSERRMFFGESDDLVCRKAAAAIDSGLAPIVCVGEPIERRRSGQTRDWIEAQVWNSLMGLPDITGLVLAYEPIWAIGTGATASPSDAVEAIVMIRETLAGIFDAGTAADLRVLYGGSVTAANAGSFFVEPEIDGALVGGASLKSESFAQIVRAAVPA